MAIRMDGDLSASIIFHDVLTLPQPLAFIPGSWLGQFPHG